MVYFAKWKMILVAIVCVFGLAFAFPNLLSDEEAAGMPGWLPSQKMNLGLDLQGGAHLLLEVDVKTVFQQRNESMIDSLRIGMRRATPRIGYRRLGVRGDCFGFDLRKEADQPSRQNPSFPKLFSLCITNLLNRQKAMRT